MIIDDMCNYRRKNYHRKKYKIEFCKVIFDRGFPSLGIWLILRCTYASVPIAGSDLPWLDLNLRIQITTVSKLVSVQFCLASLSSHSCNSYSVFLGT